MRIVIRGGWTRSPQAPPNCWACLRPTTWWATIDAAPRPPALSAFALSFPAARESTPISCFKEPNSAMWWPLKSWLWRLVHWDVSTLVLSIQALNWWTELSQLPAISLKKDIIPNPPQALTLVGYILELLSYPMQRLSGIPGISRFGSDGAILITRRGIPDSTTPRF